MDTSLFDPQATTVQHLRYMIALAEAGSFRKAAERLFIAQPTLSASIAQWEQRMDCSVFERGARGTTLTPVGERVIMAARKALDALEAMERLAVEAAPPFYGPVRLGVIPTIGPYALPYIHQTIGEEFPELHMPVEEATTAESLQSLDAGRIDMAMVALLGGMEGRYEVAPIYSEPFYASLPEGHSHAERDEIEAQQLANEGLLLLDEGHCLREQTLELCTLQQRQNFGPQYRATSLETLRHLVVAGHGVTVVPALALGQPRPGEVLIPLANQASRLIVFLWRHTDPRADAYHLIARALRKRLPKLVQLA